MELSTAAELDRSDPLAHYRDRFYIPKYTDGSNVIYLCGNSLGLQPKSARAYIDEILDDWAKYGVEGHFKAKHPWMPYHELLTEQTARLVGAKPSEVVVMNSLTVNLHLMMVSFYRPTTERHKIVIENNAFPSDLYAVKSQLAFHGYDPDKDLLEMCPRPGEKSIRTEDIEYLIQERGDSIALIMFGGVNYYTGQAFDMKKITQAGHDKGCIVGFDLAHVAGNIELKLHDWNVDFAVWCSYKYLNGGPGTTAGCFVHERHAKSEIRRFAGWWGQNKLNRFKMEPEFNPIPGAEGWQLSNPAILPMAALRASMDIFNEVGMTALRDKSEKLTGYMESLLSEQLGDKIDILTPTDPAQRGCQLSLRAKHNGKLIHSRLTESGVICDWREPDVIRVAPVPLYNTFTDVFNFVEILKHVSA